MYKRQDNRQYFFKENSEGSDYMHSWQFVAADSIDESTIKEVNIKISGGVENNPNHNQTVALYEYIANDQSNPFTSISGIIENEKNIWMHPPRDKFFNILQLNPYPFIQAPFEVGHTWEWSLQIGGIWGDKRWKTWEGIIENKCIYTITSKKKTKTAFGELDCYTIESNAISELGETKLTALFNTTYGFMELAYTNIDSSTTRLQLNKLIKAKDQVQQ